MVKDTKLFRNLLEFDSDQELTQDDLLDMAASGAVQLENGPWKDYATSGWEEKNATALTGSVIPHHVITYHADRKYESGIDNKFETQAHVEYIPEPRSYSNSIGVFTEVRLPNVSGRKLKKAASQHQREAREALEAGIDRMDGSGDYSWK